MVGDVEVARPVDRRAVGLINVRERQDDLR
jgi:hypothetical protein